MAIADLILSDSFSAEEALSQIASDRDAGALAIRVIHTPAGEKTTDRIFSFLRETCAEAYIPVYYQSAFRSLEEIKKALYAGCEAVVLDPATAQEIQTDAEKRFGTDAVLRQLPVKPIQPAFSWDDLQVSSEGLIPCIVQQEGSGEVLMLAYMNAESFAETCQTGRMTYWSRSRQELWTKGESSGHTQFLRRLFVDCDADTLLAVVRQKGVACHTGRHSCFYRSVWTNGRERTDSRQILQHVYDLIAARQNSPREGSYTNYLFSEGLDKVLKKVGEEATETVIAAKNMESEECIYEIADLLYHLMVLMRMKGLTWDDINTELAMRES